MNGFNRSRLARTRLEVEQSYEDASLELTALKMEQQTSKSFVTRSASRGNRVLRICAVSVILLAIVDLNRRYKSIGERYTWLEEQRGRLEHTLLGEPSHRNKRDVSPAGADNLRQIQSKLRSFEWRLNRSEAFKAVLSSPLAILLPHLRGPAGLPGTSGQRGENGDAGEMGETGKAGPRGPSGKDNLHYLNNTGTSTYTIWGRMDCPNNEGTKIVYTGYSAGQMYTQPGGMSNTVCLHSNASFQKFSDAADTGQYIYGQEYEVSAYSPFKRRGLHNKDAPCTVCEVETRGTQVLIAGRNICPDGWTLEYKGYLMSGGYGNKGRSAAVCVDNNAEGFPRSGKDQNGNLWYTIQASCGSLPCGPYVNGRELTCAVCTI